MAETEEGCWGSGRRRAQASDGKARQPRTSCCLRRLVLLLPAAAWPSTVGALTLQGELPSNRDYSEYVGKFCYDFTKRGWDGDTAPPLTPASSKSIVGNVNVTLESTGGPLDLLGKGKVFFAVFDDEKQHWKKIRRKWASSTCEEKKAEASMAVDIHMNSAGTGKFEINIREHLRPRFWYFTFLACDHTGIIPLRYTIHATNDMHGWEKEITLDHMGLYRIYEIFTVLFVITGSMTAWVTRWRSAAVQDPSLKEHPYIQLLTIAYVSSAASCALSLVHYFMYIRDGFGSLRMRFLAVFAGVIANCTIYLIAILASSGWAITTANMPHRRIFLGLITVVGGLHAMSELRAELAVDDSTQLYSYQGGSGVLSLILKLFMFCWFAYQVKSSYDDELHEKKRRFYKYLGVSLGGWAVNIPVTVILAFLLSPWWRYKVVVGVDITARFLGLCLLSHLLAGPHSPISQENTFSLARLGEEVGFT